MSINYVEDNFNMGMIYKLKLSFDVGGGGLDYQLICPQQEVYLMTFNQPCITVFYEMLSILSA